jgi:hypothetical protein
MAKTIITYVPARFYESANRFNFSTPYEGISSFAGLIAKYTGVQFIADSTGNKWNNNNCGRFSSGNLTKYTIPVDAYQFIVHELATKINTDFGSGVPAANSDAAFLITLFVNITSLKTPNWTTLGYADAISYFGGSSFYIPLRISPKLDLGSNLVINNKAGLFGTGAIADGVNTINIVGLNNFVGNAFTLRIFNFDGTGVINSLGTAAGVVGAGGIINTSISITYTSGPAFFRFDSLDGFAYNDFGGNVFQAFNFGYGGNYTNINLERSDTDGIPPLVFA